MTSDTDDLAEQRWLQEGFLKPDYLPDEGGYRRIRRDTAGIHASHHAGRSRGVHKARRLAKAVAPYLHPRLSRIEHSGDYEAFRNAIDMTDDELAAIAAAKVARHAYLVPISILVEAIG